MKENIKGDQARITANLLHTPVHPFSDQCHNADSNNGSNTPSSSGCSWILSLLSAEDSIEGTMSQFSGWIMGRTQAEFLSQEEMLGHVRLAAVSETSYSPVLLSFKSHPALISCFLVPCSHFGIFPLLSIYYILWASYVLEMLQQVLLSLSHWIFDVCDDMVLNQLEIFLSKKPQQSKKTKKPLRN